LIATRSCPLQSPWGVGPPENSRPFNHGKANMFFHLTGNGGSGKALLPVRSGPVWSRVYARREDSPLETEVGRVSATALGTCGARTSIATTKVALLDKCKLRSEAKFYCFVFHKSQKSLTVAGPRPANNAASRIMPTLLMSSAPFPCHSCLSTHTDA